MVKLGKKAKIEPVREANELAVNNEVEVKEEKKELSVKESILADVKKLSIANQWAGFSDKLKYEEIEAILNKYL